jgi:hypothetical protein
MVAKAYCPVCEEDWALPAGSDCPKHEIPLEAEPPRAGVIAEPGTSGELVTVGRYAEAGAAEAARIRLEAEGIPTFLQGERMGSMSMYQVATGGIALQVPRTLAADARILLSQSWATSVGEDDLDDAWEELAPEPGARRRAVMKAIILVLLFGPVVAALVAWLVGG